MARGFFKSEEIVLAPNCEKCRLDATCQSPRMPVYGQGKKRILLIGEAPGAQEDLRNIPFIGKSGEFLRREFDSLGINMDEDCWRTNAVNCRPPENATPTKGQVSHCRPYLLKSLQKYRPKHVFLIGGTAVQSFFMGNEHAGPMEKFHGRNIPDYDLAKAYIHPIYHPAFVLRKMDEGEAVLNLFRRDLENASTYLEESLPKRWEPWKDVTSLYQFDDIMAVLRNTVQSVREPISFDYETTGLKPYRSGHRIETLAYSNGEWCYSFPIGRPGHFDSDQINQITIAWKRICRHPDIPLIAHNLKFEDMWTREIIGCIPESWHWDTLSVQHLLDSRPQTKGLKFQAYVRWGIPDYDRDIKPFLKAPSSNDFNTVHLAPLDKLLEYNGVDAFTTHRLWKEQESEIRDNRLGFIRNFYHQGVIALADVNEKGIRVDEKYYQEQEKSVEIKQAEILQRIYSDPLVQKYKEVERLYPELTKDDQIRKLLFTYGGYSVVKQTEGEKDSVDKEVLQVIGTQLCQDILEFRKLDKVKTTYIRQFLRESVEEVMHPFFELHVAETGRSSSTSPNFQNVPVRNEEAKKISRSGIYPDPGCKMCEIDYSAIEVSAGGCLTKDPALVAYCRDPSTDMHRDQAIEIFLLPQDKINKNLRYYAKNGFVFPEFYGAWYGSISRNIEENCFDLEIESGLTVKQHLKSQGIVTSKDWKAHIQAVEKKFWDRFPVFREWQQNTIAFYEKYGYVKNLFGFRRSGNLSQRQILNSPIQGTAFHLLLWSLIQINRTAKQEAWKSRVMGQIHDSIVLSINPAEERHVILTANRIMTKDISETFPEIIIPLRAEPEITDVDCSWYTKKEVSMSYYLEDAGWAA